MEWFIKLMQNPESLAHLVILYALVISLGVRLGRWRIGGKNGIAFGVTWVLSSVFSSDTSAHIIFMQTLSPPSPDKST